MLGPVQNREPVLHLAGGNQPSSDLVPLARSRRPRDYVMFVQPPIAGIQLRNLLSISAHLERSLPRSAPYRAILPVLCRGPRSRYEEAVGTLQATYAAYAGMWGKFDDPQNVMGPLISAHQRDRVMAYIESGKQEGARLIACGNIATDKGGGFFVEPTCFVDVTNDMTIAREEIFGPVPVVIPYEDEEDAIRIPTTAITAYRARSSPPTRSVRCASPSASAPARSASTSASRSRSTCRSAATSSRASARNGASRVSRNISRPRRSPSGVESEGERRTCRAVRLLAGSESAWCASPGPRPRASS